MAASTFYNRVKYTAVSAGTGDFVTSAVVTGFRTPATASIPDGTLVSYIAFSSNQSEWETGQGAYTVATTTVARTTIRESSNSGFKVNFTAAPKVAVDYHSQDLALLAPLISPSFTTPALGVATASSLAIAGATIGTDKLAVTGTSLFTGAVTFTGAQAFSVTNTYDIGTSATVLAPRTVYAGTSFVGPVGTFTTSITSAKGTLTGGTLADQAQVLAITATQPATITGTQNAVVWTITSAGSSAQVNQAFALNYNAGYTGAYYAIGLGVTTSTLSTGNGGITGGVGNYGIYSETPGNGTGHNIGVVGTARLGLVNAGVVGLALTNKNSGTNIGVVGRGLNGGSSPVQVGGFFAFDQTTVPTVSAALIADNGSQTDAIFLARDNGTTVFTIADGGGVTTTGNITKLGGAVLLTTSSALTDGAGASTATMTNAPAIGNPTKWIGINDNGTTRYIPAW